MLEYLYQALSSPYGIKLRTTDVERLRQRLYAIRREACDDALSALALVPSPADPSILWIVKRNPNGNSKE